MQARTYSSDDGKRHIAKMAGGLRTVFVGFRLIYRYRYRLSKCSCFGSVTIIIVIVIVYLLFLRLSYRNY